MKRMLFNATHAEELRVAIVEGQKLIDLDIEAAGREQRKSNIYKGVITRVEPSLEACFITYGEERHGFLPFKEISRQYFRDGSDAKGGRVQDAVKEGMELFVQVEKEERGNKGAALTTFISLAGRYLVLMPNNPRGGGVSRRVEGEDRQELREVMDSLELPQGMSIIARTAGIGRTAPELQWDLNYLMQLWRAVEGAGNSQTGAFLIYQESSLVIRAIRDYFQPDIGELLIDTDDVYEQARQFMAHVMPDMVNRVKRYRDDVPLFSRFQIEHQIETAHSRTVPLPSGGAIVIDHTEALVSIDVNSARATRGSDIEETASRTNLEAAEEAARQMRLRDLGGLIVIDFIDMESARNQKDVEQRLKDALRYDRARVQTGKISRFGLMELSRQRLRPSLSEGSHVVCPRCNGTGHIRDIESSALHVLRIIQEEAMKENTAAVYTQVPVEVATFLLNEKRADIAKIEMRLKVNVVLIPNKNLDTPHYTLERLKHDDPRLETSKSSYDMVEPPAEPDAYQRKPEDANARPRQEAVVRGITPEQPAPVVERPAPAVVPAPASVSPVVHASTPSLFNRFVRWFKGEGDASMGAPKAATIVAAASDTTRATPRPARNGAARGEGSADRTRGGRGGRGARNRSDTDRTERPRAERSADRPAAADGERTKERSERRPRGEEAQGRAPRGDGRSEGRSEGRSDGRSEGRSDTRRGRGAKSADASESVRETAIGETAPRAERPPRGEARKPRGESRGESKDVTRAAVDVSSDEALKQRASEALVASSPAVQSETERMDHDDEMRSVNDAVDHAPDHATDHATDLVARDAVDGESDENDDPQGETAADRTASANGANGGRRRRRGGRGRSRRERDGDATGAASSSDQADDPAAQSATDSDVHDAEVADTAREARVVEPHQARPLQAESPAAFEPSRAPSAHLREHDLGAQVITAMPPHAELDESDALPLQEENEDTRVRFERSPEPQAGSATTVSLSAPAAAVDAPAEAPALMKAPGIEAPVRIEAAARPAPVAPVQAPMTIVDLQGLLSNAGLELVDTDANKLAKARVEPSRAPVVARVVRERKRLPPPPPEPLAQVETRKH